MRYLRQQYRVVSLQQLCVDLREGHAVRPTLAITFDDGYRDLYTYAFPVLKQYEIPATIYLIGQCMETGEAPWYDRIFAVLETAPGPFLEVELDSTRVFQISSPEDRREAAWQIVCYLRMVPNRVRRRWCLDFESRFPSPQRELQDRMLNWNQVRLMKRSGIHFGAHTMSHPVVAQLAVAELEEELVHPKRLLEDKLEASVDDFAYPFGKFADVNHPAAGQYLETAGYRSAVTTIEGLNGAGSDLFSLRRLQIGDDGCLSLFAVNVDRMFLEGPPPAAAVVERRVRERIPTHPSFGG